jgi:two-component system chemotaxis response regulator CheY
MLKKILIVDDSATVRQTVSITLDKNGYKSLSAVDGQDALKVLEKEVVDMVITDLNMPNLDGFGLTKELRNGSKTRFTPIIILTTETDSDMKAKGREVGASGWIEKPFQAINLIKVVRMALGA